MSELSYLSSSCQNSLISSYFISPISSWGVRSHPSLREVSDLSFFSVRCLISPISLWDVRSLSSICYFSVRCQISPISPWGVRSLSSLHMLSLPFLREVSDLTLLSVRRQIHPISPWGVRSLPSLCEVSDLFPFQWGGRSLPSFHKVSDMSHPSVRCQISPIPPWGVCQIYPIPPREVTDISLSSVPWGVRSLPSLHKVSTLSYLSVRCKISPISQWGVKSALSISKM